MGGFMDRRIGKLKLKMVPGSSTSCFELFLELYSIRDSPLAIVIPFLSCHGLSKGLRTGVNEDVG